ncbi:MAG TPA: preprotein translocase subunit SecG [Candidatus Limnocylindrales bacterium]|nr:preprotein translocase subunit SecG [Candidatus Limnocylindrales bacterium]
MTVLLVAVHVIACLVLILVVLLQAGRGADMGAAFGGASSPMFGSGSSANPLARLTTATAITFMATSLLLAVLSARQGSVFDAMTEPLAAPPQAETAPADGVPGVIPATGGGETDAPFGAEAPPASDAAKAAQPAGDAADGAPPAQPAAPDAAAPPAAPAAPDAAPAAPAPDAPAPGANAPASGGAAQDAAAPAGNPEGNAAPPAAPTPPAEAAPAAPPSNAAAPAPDARAKPAAAPDAAPADKPAPAPGGAAAPVDESPGAP